MIPLTSKTYLHNAITLETVLSTTYNQYNMAYRGQRSLADADRVVGTEIEKAFLKGTPDEYLLNKNLQQFTMIKRNGLENEIARNRIYNLTGLMTRQELINIAKKMKKKAMNGGLTDKDYRMYDESVINDCLARVKNIRKVIAVQITIKPLIIQNAKPPSNISSRQIGG